jgi:hypothetical protein
MRETKKEKLKAVVELFRRKKVLKIDEFFTVFKTQSPRTVRRYIKELKYLTSYSHAGKYYTLFELAEFDANGLWHYGDIGFSKHGTLLDTIVYLVKQSSAGMTHNELQEKFHLVVKAALIDLVKKHKLTREKRMNLYVYLNPDSDGAQKQLRAREKSTSRQLIDQGVAFRVLLAAYKIIEEFPTPEQVAHVLKREGSKISLEVVQQVFCYYELEKKTSDSNCFRS